MRTKSRVFLLTMLMVMLGASPVQAAKHKTTAIGARSAIAMDLATGRILFEENADEQIPPASLTKVLTLYLAFEAVQEKRLALTEPVLVTPEATLSGGSRMNIRPGERVIVRELMKGIAVASGNDACIALAQHLSGTEDASPFVAAMNAKARELGMNDSTFKNPNGMPAEGQLTTARDMLKLSASYLRRFPQSLTFHSMTSYVHNNRNHHNANRLLSSYEGVDGLKTGFVQASGYNNIVTAKRGNTRLVAVVLGARSASSRATASRRLLDLAFAKLADNPAGLATLDEQNGRGTLPVALAKHAPRQQDRDLKAANALADAKAVQLLDDDQPQASVKPSPPAALQAAAPIARKTPQGGYAIQESSFQSRLKAERRAQHLERKGLPVKVVAARLDGKGTFYRVLVGPYANADNAKKTRGRLQATSVE